MNNEVQLMAGAIVEVAACPQWGPGKIVHRSGDTLHIIFRDLEEEMARKFTASAPALRLATSQSDPILDNLPPLIEKNGRWVLPTRPLTLESLKQKFLNVFPAGFADEQYLVQERDYKLAAHVRFKKLLGTDGIRQLLKEDRVRELAEKGISVIGPLNLLFSHEQAAFHDAMKDDDAVRSFYSALMAVLDTDPITEEVFSAFADAVCDLPAERGRVAKWTVATAFPYIAQPDRFMFLKPQVTQEAAESLRFDLKYESTPNWKTYEALLTLGRTYFKLLRPLGARDFVDVQSFIWITCGGYEAVATKKKKAKSAKLVAQEQL